MRTTQYPLSTLKEIPTDAEVISHQLMLRAGLIRQVASGLYTWLPTGLRVLRKIEAIVREEMNRAGAIEISMPVVQPAELWRETERWEQYGPELLRFTDRHQRWFVLGPTHEEVVTHLVRSEISSYKQLPLNLYQIQTKFRDEIRPRFGVMRAREFTMKDSYSFHTSQASLQTTYEAMYQAYQRIFTRLGLDFRPVQADTGSIGGHYSHEFQVLADSGEDQIVFSSASNYAANIELATALPPSQPRAKPQQALQRVDKPELPTLAALAQSINLPLNCTVKTIIVQGDKQQGHPWVALLLRGDHQLNTIKVEKLPLVACPLTLASAAQTRALVGAEPEALGPIDLALPLIIDHAVAVMSDFAAGANINGQYYLGMNWQRDVPLPPSADLRNVVEGDLSPDGQGVLQIKRGIEVGQIFQLGTKYSAALNATVQGENGQAQPLLMGCYGIGISRIVAAAIEQHHDARGIVWPEAMAPFKVALLPINAHKSQRVHTIAEQLYATLLQAGIEVLFDDRPARPGVIFTDMDLIGVSYRVVISDSHLDNGQVECQQRCSGEVTYLQLEQLADFLLAH